MTVAGFKDSDKIYMDNVRDALLFLGTAKELGFPSILSVKQESMLSEVSDYFSVVGGQIIDLIDNVNSKRSVQMAENMVSEVVSEVDVLDKSVVIIRDCFFLLKSFEVWLTQDKGYYVTPAKETVKEVIEASSAAMSCLLTDLYKTAEEYETTKLGPSMLPELYRDFLLCEKFSAVEEYLPSVDTLRFNSVANLFRTTISIISSSTRDRIQTQDFDGILDDLKGFDRGKPVVSKEVRSILQQVSSFNFIICWSQVFPMMCTAVM